MTIKEKRKIKQFADYEILLLIHEAFQNKFPDTTDEKYKYFMGCLNKKITDEVFNLFLDSPASQI